MAVQGTVRDEHGMIVERASVAVYRRDRRGGRIELMPAGSAGVDDLGRYTIAGLWQGDYAVCAEPPAQWPTYFMAPGESEIEYHPGGERRVYTETCYSDPKSQSTLVQVSSGAQQRLDLTIGSASSITLKTNIPVALYREDSLRWLPAPGSDPPESVDGSWLSRNVTPGNYLAYAIVRDDSGSPGGPGSVARQPITIASKDLTLELHPEKRGRIAVHLHGSNGQAIEQDAAAVSFVRFGGITLMERFGAVGALDPGKYWVAIHPKPPWCVISQAFSGGTFRNGEVTVTPAMSARLDLELGSVCGAIDIRAASNGEPVPFANFLLLVNGTPQEPGDAVTGNFDAHGHASIPRVAPGRYQLWAWTLNAGGYSGPDLADPASRPLEVVVSAGQTATASIDPARSPGAFR